MNREVTISPLTIVPTSSQAIVKAMLTPAEEVLVALIAGVAVEKTLTEVYEEGN